MAELPDSVKQLSPNETRNVEAAYLHCGLDKGSLVQAKVRVDGNLELVQFNARNSRPITPLAWKLDLCEGFVTKLETADRPHICLMSLVCFRLFLFGLVFARVFAPCNEEVLTSGRR